MKRVEYPLPLKSLIAELKRMPGVGPRSAERIALWMVQRRDARPEEIGRAIADAAAHLRLCQLCGFFTTDPVCAICADPERDHTQLCVVEQPTDILPLERTGAFKGRYHTQVGGRISPLDHVGPENLRLDSLLRRIAEEQPAEIILALSADVEGEATASYIASLLRDSKVAMTRLAQGLPAGSGLEFADELTLSRALSGRRPV